MNGLKGLLPSLLFFLFLSCISNSHPIFLDLTSNRGEGLEEGSIWDIHQEKDRIIIQGGTSEDLMTLRFTGEFTGNLYQMIMSSTEYLYRRRDRPDGPIEFLILKDDAGITAFVGDGLREEVLPGTDFKIQGIPGSKNTIRFSSDKERKILSIGKSHTINIDGFSYDAYLLNLIQGVPGLDQPPFQIDLILIRQ